MAAPSCMIPGKNLDNVKEDFRSAVKIEQYRFGKEALYVPEGLRWKYLPYTAIEKAEASGATAGSDAYREAIIAAMKATDMDCVTGHVTYNEYNNPEKSAAIITIENGAAKFWGNY